MRYAIVCLRQRKNTSWRLLNSNRGPHLCYKEKILLIVIEVEGTTLPSVSIRSGNLTAALESYSQFLQRQIPAVVVVGKDHYLKFHLWEATCEFSLISLTASATRTPHPIREDPKKRKVKQYFIIPFKTITCKTEMEKVVFGLVKKKIDICSIFYQSHNFNLECFKIVFVTTTVYVILIDILFSDWFF